jgi:hypothetical protein
VESKTQSQVAGMTGQRLNADCVRVEQVRVLPPHPISRLAAKRGFNRFSSECVNAHSLRCFPLLTGRVFQFLLMKASRCGASAGQQKNERKSSQELLISQLSTPGRLRLVWLRLLSVRRSLRSSSERVGSRNCFARLLNPRLAGLRVALTGLIIIGCASCEAHPFSSNIPGVKIGRTIPVPTFWTDIKTSAGYGVATTSVLIPLAIFMRWHVSHD